MSQSDPKNINLVGERDNTFLTSMVVDPMDAAMRKLGTADSAKDQKRPTARDLNTESQRGTAVKTGIGASKESPDKSSN